MAVKRMVGASVAASMTLAGQGEPRKNETNATHVPLRIASTCVLRPDSMCDVCDTKATRALLRTKLWLRTTWSRFSKLEVLPFP